MEDLEGKFGLRNDGFCSENDDELSANISEYINEIERFDEDFVKKIEDLALLLENNSVKSSNSCNLFIKSGIINLLLENINFEKSSITISIFRLLVLISNTINSFHDVHIDDTHLFNIYNLLKHDNNALKELIAEFFINTSSKSSADYINYEFFPFEDINDICNRELLFSLYYNILRYQTSSVGNIIFYLIPLFLSNFEISEKNIQQWNQILYFIIKHDSSNYVYLCNHPDIEYGLNFFDKIVSTPCLEHRYYVYLSIYELLRETNLYDIVINLLSNLEIISDLIFFLTTQITNASIVILTLILKLRKVKSFMSDFFESIQHDNMAHLYSIQSFPVKKILLKFFFVFIIESFSLKYAFFLFENDFFEMIKDIMIVDESGKVIQRTRLLYDRILEFAPDQVQKYQSKFDEIFSN